MVSKHEVMTIAFGFGIVVMGLLLSIQMNMLSNEIDYLKDNIKPKTIPSITVNRTDRIDLFTSSSDIILHLTASKIDDPAMKELEKVPEKPKDEKNGKSKK